MRLVMKCAYCGERIVVELNSRNSDIVISGMKSKDLLLCRKCCNDKGARVWLTKQIMEG